MSYVDKNGLQEYSTKLWNKIKLKIGSPLTAATAADMTDTDRVYVYTGSETGYTAGNWYYHNGTAWTSGGAYNSVAVNTDTDLINAGVPADAKTAGNAIDNVYKQYYGGTSISGGNEWFAFKIVSGRKYIFVNKSSSAGMVVHTLPQASGYSYIEQIGSGTIDGGKSVEFTPQQNAEAIVVYGTGAGDFEIYAYSSFDEVYKRINEVSDYYNVGSDIGFEIGGITSNENMAEGENDRTDRIRTTTIVPNVKSVTAYHGATGSDITVAFIEYDADGEFISNNGKTITASPVTYVCSANCKYLRLVCFTGTLSDITGYHFTFDVNEAKSANDKVLNEVALKNIEAKMLVDNYTEVDRGALQNSNAGAQQSVGNTLSITSSTWLKHFAATVVPGKTYRVTFRVSNDTSLTRNYVVLADANGIITAVYPYTGDGAYRYETLTITIPSGTTNIYWNNVTNTGDEVHNCKLYLIEKDEFDFQKIDELPYRANDGMLEKSTNMVARNGYMVYAANTPPEQTVASYALAYRHGFRAFLCDLQVTSDGYFVCVHDTDFYNSSVVKNADGTTIASHASVSDYTLEELNTLFDFGVYKGQEYAGTPVPMLSNVMKLCSDLNCLLFLETKVQLTKAQVEEIAYMAINNSLSNQFVWAFDWAYDTAVTTPKYLHDVMPSAGLLIRRIDSSTLSQVTSMAEDLRTAYPDAKIYITIVKSGLTRVTPALLSTLAENQIELYYSEIETQSDMVDFADQYSHLFKFIATRYDLNEYLLFKYGIV